MPKFSQQAKSLYYFATRLFAITSKACDDPAQRDESTLVLPWDEALDSMNIDRETDIFETIELVKKETNPPIARCRYARYTALAQTGLSR